MNSLPSLNQPGSSDFRNGPCRTRYLQNSDLDFRLTDRRNASHSAKQVANVFEIWCFKSFCPSISEPMAVSSLHSCQQLQSTALHNMTTLPAILKYGHLFLEVDNNLWLFDTGAPISFGRSDIVLDETRFQLAPNYLGLTLEDLAEFTGVQCHGLLGGDVLGNFDHLIDATKGTVAISTGRLEHSGVGHPLDEFMGIPTLNVQIVGRGYRMFFDTGAQISYFQEDSIKNFPNMGKVSDFYPGVGQFQTDTHNVPMTIGSLQITLRCGILPGMLGKALALANISGIVGNQLCINRMIGYFPRRKALHL